MSRKTAGDVTFLHLDAPRRKTPVAGHVALVPGGEAPLLALQLPPGLQGAAREQVAWRQLQDQLGLSQDSAEMHPFSGPDPATPWTRALVSEAGAMHRWRDRLDPGCRALLPDYLALPAAADLWVVALRGDAVQVRLGLLDGFTAEPELAQLMLAQMLADEEVTRPGAVLLLEGNLPWLEDMLAKTGVTLVRDITALAALEIAAPVVLGHGELAADLRIDARAARRQLRRQLLPWAAAVLAGGLMIGIWAAGEMLKIGQMQREHAALQRNVETLVRDYFVPTGPLLDVRLQVSRALAAQQAEGAAGAGRVSPLLLIGQAADVLMTTEAEPEHVTYSQTEGLVIGLRLADFAALDQLVAALEQVGLAAEPRDARVVEDSLGGVRAELYLQPKQAEVGQ